jgi:hypothetical protein
MSEHYQPQLGEYGCVRTPDFMGLMIRLVTCSRVNHVFVYVGKDEKGYDRIVEAEPKGARLGYLWEYSDIHWSGPAITQGKGPQIAEAAKRLIGRPYSFGDCVCIGLADIFGGHRLPHFVRARIEDVRRLMCSALTDYAFWLGGVHLFDDGRLFGDVSPGDLDNLATAARH